MIITDLQQSIFEFAKASVFHITLDDYVKNNSQVEYDDALVALNDLKRKRIVSTDPTFGIITVTNYGWRQMGWGLPYNNIF